MDAEKRDGDATGGECACVWEGGRPKYQFRDFVRGFPLHVHVEVAPQLISSNGSSFLDRVAFYQHLLRGEENRSSYIRSYDLQGAFLAACKSGRSDKGSEPGPRHPDHQADLAARISVGSRFETDGARRGTVRYVGRCEALPPGFWVGVEVSGRS